MNTIRENAWSCYYCGYNINAVSDPNGGATPSTGDITVCLNCGGAYVLHEKWEPITDAEYKSLPKDFKDELKALERIRRIIIKTDLAPIQVAEHKQN